MKKVKKSIYIYIYTHRYCLQSFLAEIKNLVKKILHLMCVEKRKTNKFVRKLFDLFCRHIFDYGIIRYL